MGVPYVDPHGAWGYIVFCVDLVWRLTVMSYSVYYYRSLTSRTDRCPKCDFEGRIKNKYFNLFLETRACSW